MKVSADSLPLSLSSRDPTYLYFEPQLIRDNLSHLDDATAREVLRMALERPEVRGASTSIDALEILHNIEEGTGLLKKKQVVEELAEKARDKLRLNPDTAPSEAQVLKEKNDHANVVAALTLALKKAGETADELSRKMTEKHIFKSVDEEDDGFDYEDDDSSDEYLAVSIKDLTNTDKWGLLYEGKSVTITEPMAMNEFIAEPIAFTTNGFTHVTVAYEDSPSSKLAPKLDSLRIVDKENGFQEFVYDHTETED